MKKTSAKIVFFGNERLATGVVSNTPTLLALIKAGYEVAAIVTSFTAAKSRKARELEIEQIANNYAIPLLAPAKLSEIKPALKAYGAECGVLVAFGKIVPEEIIEIFPRGIINVHPSALPKHRGPTPIESVILDGSQDTAVSLMQLVKAMDAGPVYVQQPVQLTGQETKQELADNLAAIGSKLVIEHLPAILSSKATPAPQNEAEATYDSLISKSDGLIDWNLRAETIERQIRAYAGWPGSRTELFGKEVQLLKAVVVDKTGIPGEVFAQDKNLFVCCGDKAMHIELLKPAGKKEMTGKNFLAGYGKQLKH